MKKIQIIRLRDVNKIQTLGHAIVFDGIKKEFEFWTLEPPWLDNAKRISCIPQGHYFVEKYQSPQYGLVFLFDGVPNRDYIEIHPGNYHMNTKGCILPGAGFTDINKDGLLDVHSSKKTHDRLLDIMPDKFIISITWL